MQLNRKRVQLIERLANSYRHRKLNRFEDKHDRQVSKAQHPSRARAVHRENSSLEKTNDR